MTDSTRLRRLTDLQALLTRVARDIGPALELQPVLSTVLTAMRSVMAFKGGTICLVDEAGTYIAAADPPVSEELHTARVPVGTGLAGRVIAHGQPIYSPDLDADPRVDPQLRRLGSNQTMTSYLAVPLVCLGEVIGLLQVDSTEVDAFDEDDIAILQGLATQVAGAIESARRHEEILELERLKGDFVGRVSHELRTPLVILTQSLDLLDRNDPTATPQDREDLLRAARTAADRLRFLIDELLMVTTLESGGLAPNVTDTVLRDVLVEAVDHARAPERVVVDADPDLRLAVDARILRQVLGLLVDNACQYAPDGPVEVAAHAEGGVTVIAVRDEGPGVPTEERERIFDRFYRATSEGPGMGLGLAIARTLAASLGATLSCTEPPSGEGASFELRFVA